MKTNIRVGVIADMEYSISPAFSSYYYACVNIFKDVKLINNVKDLENVDIVVCGNDHFYNHFVVWSNQEFIDYCNDNKIQFFAHTVEHINSPVYTHNIQIQNKLESFNLLRQRCWDINDSKEKNTNIARVLLSKNFMNYKNKNLKKNKIIFIGKVYQNRRELFDKLTKHIEVDIFERSFDYPDFISKLSEYKYVLSPKSMSVNGIPGRFYESLLVDSIPIQEVSNDTLDYYTIERDIPNTIFFQTIEELINKIELTKNLDLIEQPKMFLEDELIEFFKEFGIL